MKLYGLIGYPLTHSFSKQYFTDKFDREGIKNCRYDNYPIREINLLPEIIMNNSNLLGLNVTIPYKEQVIPYLDGLDDESKSIGAVNTIKIYRIAGRPTMKGYNTDTYGFTESLKPYLKSHHKNAVILGTGGASKAVAFSLEKMGLTVIFVSRNPRQANHLSYATLKEQTLSNYQVIINTTPAGMYPDTKNLPDLPYDSITSRHILFDLIYNPRETQFLKFGKQNGALAINGLKMLHLQAEKAWEIWNK